MADSEPIFRWSTTREKAALALAGGKTQREAAEESGCGERTIRTWLTIPEFAEEVDRLTLMTGIAQKAERLRTAKRMIAKIGDNTEKDLLDWLKYAQSETDGIRLDLAQLLTSLTTDGEELADSGSTGSGQAVGAESSSG